MGNLTGGACQACARDACRSSRAPVVLVDEDEEAALRGVDERAQALVGRGVPVPHLLQHDAAHDDVVDCRMLQQVHLQVRMRGCLIKLVVLVSHYMQQRSPFPC